MAGIAKGDFVEVAAHPGAPFVVHTGGCNGPAHFGICSADERDDGYFQMYVVHSDGTVVDAELRSRDVIAYAWAGWFPESDEETLFNWLWENGPDWWRALNADPDFF